MKFHRKQIAIIAGVVFLALVGWRIFGQDQPSGSAGAPVQPPIPIVAGQVSIEDVPLYLTGVGTVQAYNTVNVQVRVDGQLDSVDFREGQDVKQGDRLAQIDPRPYQAALDNALANLARDQATLANARRDLGRYADTAAKGYSSRQQLDTQQSTVGSLEATVQADQATIESARVQLGYTTITAPIDGRTGIRKVDRGNIVHATDTGALVVITQIEPISVIFTLPQDVLPKVQAAEAAGALPVAAFTRDDTTALGEGTLELVDNEIDPTTGTIRLKARFPNPTRALWPGQFVNVRLQVGVARHAITVDSRVAQRGPEGSFAYVIKPDDTVEVRPIEQGQDYRGRLVVTKGLAPQERVVVDGQLRLQAGSKVSIEPDETPQKTGSLETPPSPDSAGR
jgi:multidrug efflux system membrane fusion protein